MIDKTTATARRVPVQLESLDWTKYNEALNASTNFFNKNIGHLISAVNAHKVTASSPFNLESFKDEITRILDNYDVVSFELESVQRGLVRPEVASQINNINHVMKHFKTNLSEITKRITNEFINYATLTGTPEMKTASDSYVRELIVGMDKNSTPLIMKAIDARYKYLAKNCVVDDEPEEPITRFTFSDPEEGESIDPSRRTSPMNDLIPPAKSKPNPKHPRHRRKMLFPEFNNSSVTNATSTDINTTPQKVRLVTPRKQKSKLPFNSNGGITRAYFPPTDASSSAVIEGDVPSQVNKEFVSLIIDSNLLKLGLSNEYLQAFDPENFDDAEDGQKSLLLTFKAYLTTLEDHNKEELESVYNQVIAMGIHNGIPAAEEGETDGTENEQPQDLKQADVLELVNIALTDSDFPLEMFGLLEPDDLSPLDDSVQALYFFKQQLESAKLEQDSLNTIITFINNMDIYKVEEDQVISVDAAIPANPVDNTNVSGPSVSAPVQTSTVTPAPTPVQTSTVTSTPAPGIVTALPITNLKTIYADKVKLLEKEVDLEKRYNGLLTLLNNYVKEANLSEELKVKVVAVSNAVRTMNNSVTKNKVLQNTLQLLLEPQFNKKAVDEYKALGLQIVKDQPKSKAAQVLCAAMMALGAAILTLGALICAGTLVGAPILGVAAVVGGAFLLSTGGFGLFATRSTTKKNLEYATDLNGKIDTLAVGLTPRG